MATKAASRIFVAVVLISLLSMPRVGVAAETFASKYLQGREAARVRIVSARELGFRYEDAYEVCGYNYTALLRYPISGSFPKELKLSSDFPLAVGAEYIISMTESASTDELIVEWPKGYEQAFRRCESSLRGERLGEDRFFRIDAHPMGREGEWLRIYDDSLLLEADQVILASDGDGLEYRLVPLEALSLNLPQ